MNTTDGAVGPPGKAANWKRTAANALIGEAKASELAAQVDGLRRTRQDISRWAARFTPHGRSEWRTIRRFKNMYAGSRCVIIGNGPSLELTDLSSVRNEVTFGLNRIYLMFNRLGWETTFHVVVNQLVVEQCATDFRTIRSPLFTTAPSRPILGGMPNAVFLDSIDGPRFSTDASLGVWEGATVTYVALQLAFYMGFSTVILVGVDHRFSVTGLPHQIVESAGPDANHFDANYFGKGFKWQIPDLELSESAYRLARLKFEKDGRRVIDSTVAGALNVFPKMPLETALRR